jgi:hypothetical protein
MPASFRTIDGKIIDVSIVRTLAKAGDTMTLLIDRDGNEVGTVKGRLHNVLARLQRDRTERIYRRAKRNG